jgi:hypothetical protein
MVERRCETLVARQGTEHTMDMEAMLVVEFRLGELPHSVYAKPVRMKKRDRKHVVFCKLDLQ